MNIYLLSESFYEGVINLPLIKSTCKKVQLNISKYDALIFSSKNAIFALDEITSEWKNIPAYCIGKATAKEVEKRGGKVAYIAMSAYGNDFAVEIADKLKDKKAIFLRGKKVLSSLESILAEKNVDLTSQVIYETTCRKKEQINIEKNSVIIFTSPSTIKCFFTHYPWDDSYKAVCIGKVTQKFLPLHVKCFMSKEQSIKSCIALAKTLIKQN